jgi:hypothetical protein
MGKVKRKKNINKRLVRTGPCLHSGPGHFGGRAVQVGVGQSGPGPSYANIYLKLG